MDDLSWSLYLPLLFVVLLFAAASIVAAVMGSRGNEAGAERIRDLAFALALGGTAYVAVLLLVALVSVPDLLYDMVIIVLIITAFFGILLFLLFVVFELFARGSRQRVTAGDSEG